MKLKSLQYLFIISFISYDICFASGKLWNNNNGYSFWNLKSISGLISLDGYYRSGSVDIPGYFAEDATSTFLLGEIELYTSSFLWHPNFLQLDADVGFKPFSNLDLYSISPDNSDINTTEKVNLNGIFFNERLVSINPYFNFNHAFSRREYTTNLETFYTNYGIRLNSPGLFLPTNINVSQNNWIQNEIQTGRQFSTDDFSVNAEITKSFRIFNTNTFTVDYSNFQRIYTPESIIRNKRFTWYLRNNAAFDQQNNFNLNSGISLMNQTGSQPLNKLMISENLYSDLPANLKAGIRYHFNRLYQYNIYNSNQHDIEARVEHKLFESLRSSIFYNYVSVDQTFYNERIDRVGIGFDYQKQIPTGVLQLYYNYIYSKDNRNNALGYITIIDEEKILTDGSTVLLDNPFVDLNSVAVKDITGNIIYQENFDYILLRRGSYIEIQRILGGQISNGSSVLVSYLAEQQPSLSFNTNLNTYGGSIKVLNNFSEVYFRATDQSYYNVESINAEYLNTLKQKIYGIKINIEFIELGTEYEDYNSNITPYNSFRYFLRVANQSFNKIITDFIVNYRTYDLLDEKTTQQFGDVSLIIDYLIGSQSRISLEGNYVVQNGNQIDLNLTNIKLEYLTTFRQIDISVGYQVYNRELLSDRTNYSGVFAKVSRRF